MATDALLFAAFAASSFITLWLLVLIFATRAAGGRLRRETAIAALVALVSFGVIGLLSIQPKNEQSLATQAASGSVRTVELETAVRNNEKRIVELDERLRGRIEREGLPSDAALSPSGAKPTDFSGPVEVLAKSTEDISSRPAEVAPDLAPLLRALEDIGARLPDSDRWPQSSSTVVDLVWITVLVGFLTLAWLLWYQLTRDTKLAKWTVRTKYALLALSVLAALGTALKPFADTVAEFMRIGRATQLVSLITLPTEGTSSPGDPAGGEPPVIRLDISERLTTFVIAFREEGRCANGEPVAGATLSTKSMELERQFLSWFGSSLQKCMREKQRPIELLVRGYASSSEISASALAACAASNSDEANLKFAEARRQSVESALADACGTACTFEDGAWDSYDDMKAARRYNDRQLGQYHGERGMLNRRVEITVQNASDCEMPPLRRVVGPRA